MEGVTNVYSNLIVVSLEVWCKAALLQDIITFGCHEMYVNLRQRTIIILLPTPHLPLLFASKMNEILTPVKVNGNYTIDFSVVRFSPKVSLV